MTTAEALAALHLSPENLGTYAGKWIGSALPEWLISRSPIDYAELGKISITTDEQYEAVLSAASETFQRWRVVPAPKRGDLIRAIANDLRELKEPLGTLVSLEAGKILPEGLGEVQEAIDIADFASGLSRQLYGLTMHSERPAHRMYEQWHPLGNVGVITAFNFPVAVWAWNAMLAAVCGNTVIWKASEQTPLCAYAILKVCADAAERHGFPGLFTLVTGRGDLGKKISEDHRIPLVSATGSCAMGRAVGQAVAKRLGRTLLELGGNNAVIVLDDADPELALRAIVFGAVGTAGQRCTTTRRLFVQSGMKAELTKRLIKAYGQIKIGNPLEDGVLMGPLINERSVSAYKTAIETAVAQGGKVLYGGKQLPKHASPLYVEPTIIEAPKDLPLMSEETFAPILYLVEVKDLAEAVALNNAVPQGLSSAIFTRSVKSSEQFLSTVGSDCGIANVNLGTSGAEIGGAFGGEKDTGGGRESGSDSWRAYMRRQTNTINWGDDLPLAQGIQFG